jgi:hypothetical protein
MNCHCGRHIQEAGYRTCAKCRTRSRAYYQQHRKPVSKRTVLRREGLKKCTGCEQILPCSEFSPQASRCRSCRNRIAKEKAIADATYVQTRFPLTDEERWIPVQERRAQAEALVNDIKRRLGCTDCDGDFEDSALCFDHLPEFEKLGEISVLVEHGRLHALGEEIPKCEVVCRSCHNRRGWQRGQLKGRPRKAVIV